MRQSHRGDVPTLQFDVSNEAGLLETAWHSRRIANSSLLFQPLCLIGNSDPVILETSYELQLPAPHVRQKMNFRASCTRRGARKALIWPKTVLVLLVLANPLGLTQLSVLKLSPRNCVVSFSVSLRFLMS